VVGNVDLTPLGDVTLLQVVTTQDRHAATQPGDSASATVKAADLNLAIPSLPIHVGVLESNAQVTCDANGTPTFTGDSTVADVNIAGNDIAIPPDKNTTIDASPLAVITLREEIVGDHGIIERAVAIRTPLLNVFVAESEAGATGDATCQGQPPCGTGDTPPCPCTPDETDPNECQCPDGTTTCPPTCDGDNDADDTGCPGPCSHTEGDANECPCPTGDSSTTCPPTCDGDNDADDQGCQPCTDHDNDADDSGCPPCDPRQDQTCPPCTPDNDESNECPQPCTDHDNDADDSGCPPCVPRQDQTCPPCTSDNDGDNECPQPCEEGSSSDDGDCPCTQASCPPQCDGDNDADDQGCPPGSCTGDTGDRDADNCCANASGTLVNCCSVPDHNSGDSGDDQCPCPSGSTCQPCDVDSSQPGCDNMCDESSSTKEAVKSSDDEGECACDSSTSKEAMKSDDDECEGEDSATMSTAHALNLS